MEIRIKMSVPEYENLESRANAAGLPTVNAYARDLLFPSQNYSGKWTELKSGILDLPSGEIFPVNRFLPNVPSLLGRWVWEHQEELGIEFVDKHRGTNYWRKK